MSNYLETEAGSKLYTLIQQAPEAQRDSLMQVAEKRFPGISGEFTTNKGLEALDAEALLRGFGTSSAVLPSDVVQLRSEISATHSSIENLHKTDVDEHLAVVENLSGLMLDGSYDSVFPFMKEAEREFLNSIKDEDPSRRKRLSQQFYGSFDTLWPKKYPSGPYSYEKIKKEERLPFHLPQGFFQGQYDTDKPLYPKDTYDTEGNIKRRGVQVASSISPALQALHDLSSTLEEQQKYYGGYFTDEEAMGIYEQIQFGE